MTQPEIPIGERPEMMRVWLLGGFRVSVGARTIEAEQWRLRKAAGLVKVLALAPGHRLHREQAMDILWPDSGTRAASGSLRSVLYDARKVLDPAAGSLYLTSDDDALVLCPGGNLLIDVEVFEEAAATARRAQDPAAYRSALELYNGELLPADRYEGWTEDRREELRTLHLALLLELAGLYEDRGEHALAVSALRKAINEESTLEEAHASLMRLHALSGRPERALAQYERLRDALQSGLGTQPTEAARRLRDEIAAGRLPTATPASPAQPVPSEGAKHNLPAPMSSFVGREREMVKVKRALSMTRLLTLTGVGGTGKTRLAIEVARDLAGAYPDGVWLVELAPLSEPRLVAQEVANALGVQERPGQSLVDTLSEAIAGKEVLLLLDNCEHVVEEAARLVDALLASCPRLKALATSREPLGVTGEVHWAVPPLSLPDGTTDGELAADALMRYEAIRLFVDRARLRLPDFGLAQENAGAVARVCRKLEGIPLAIELATARMGALAVEQVAQRLEVSLDVLQGSDRTAAPRQQTLGATMDWSHDLLSENERVVFRRLSAFAGGWTLEAAEAVASGEGVKEDEVLDLLSRLVDKSLVVAEASGKGGVRYRMLEPVSQYARAKLEEGDEAEHVRRRHAVFFLTLAEEAEPELWGPDDASWLNRLEQEHDNMRVALSRSLAWGEPELALRLAGALGWFWRGRGYYGEGRRWVEEALKKSSGTSSATIRAKALGVASFLAVNQGDIGRARAAAEDGLRLSAYAGLGSVVTADFQNLLGDVAGMRGDYEKAKELLEDALVLHRGSGDGRGVAWSLGILAKAIFAQGDFERAKELYEEGLALSRELGGAELLGAHLISLGYVYLLEGDLEKATALNEEALELLRKRGHKDILHVVLDNLGWAALLRGDQERARSCYEEGLTICKELGDKTIASESLEGLACISASEGEAERAATLFGAAQALREAVGYHHTPEEAALREPYLATARPQLGEVAWEETLAQGRTMGVEEAIEYALSQKGSSKPALSTPVQPSVATRPPNLTRREREVARLVSQGLTNRQIAEALFVSERTVDHHVSNILKKLNLSSREQVASRL
ncbi:MAG TPA: tetratricopeptide repeat protein, partial [Rubrobacter sp.]